MVCDPFLCLRQSSYSQMNRQELSDGDERRLYLNKLSAYSGPWKSWQPAQNHNFSKTSLPFTQKVRQLKHQQHIILYTQTLYLKATSYLKLYSQQKLNCKQIRCPDLNISQPSNPCPSPTLLSSSFWLFNFPCKIYFHEFVPLNFLCSIKGVWRYGVRSCTEKTDTFLHSQTS